jgi:AraC-like DNA-binding protein
MAKRVNKHPVYLTRAFKSHYGFDIKTFQKNLRLGHALAQKLNTEKSLTEIAYESGFSDQSHFNREFKKATGFTPKKSLKV